MGNNLKETDYLINGIIVYYFLKNKIIGILGQFFGDIPNIRNNRHLFFEKLCVCSCTWWAKHFYHVIEMAVGKGLILFLFCPKGQKNFDINDFYLKN